MLNRRDEMRIKRAINESPQIKRSKELSEKVEAAKRTAEESKQHEENLFARWQVADRFITALENIRDAHMPKTPGERFDDEFALAVKLLPGAREYAENLWYEYNAIKL